MATGSVAELLPNSASFVADELAALTGGRWLAPLRGGRVIGVNIDSRALAPGQLFVALPGARAHGLTFAQQASARGAVAIMADAAALAALPSAEIAGHAGGLPLLVVNDAVQALGQLAAAHRARWSGKLIALTASTGKTTLARLLVAALSDASDGDAARHAPAAGPSGELSGLRGLASLSARDPGAWEARRPEMAGHFLGETGTKALGPDGTAARVWGAQGNYNNHLGVPLTLLGLSPEHDYSVVEIGMNQPGEIESLGRLARPDIAIVLNAFGAHRGAFSSDLALTLEKASLWKTLSSDGLAIGPRDDARLWPRLSGLGVPFASFGTDSRSDMRVARTALRPDGALDIEVHDQHIAGRGRRLTLQLRQPNAAVAMPAAAAALTCAHLGLDLEVALKRMGQHFTPGAGRLEVLASGESLILDATYNASPLAVTANIETLAQLGAARGAPTLALLGAMGELGDASEALHRQVVETLDAQAIGETWLMGEPFAPLARPADRLFTSLDAMKRALAERRAANPARAEVVLVQGARAYGLEALVDVLRQPAG